MTHYFNWIKQPDIIELIKLLSYPNHTFYFVGGCIRDSLLGLPIADFDLASNFSPNENMDALKHSQYKIIPTGLKYGSLTIKINNSTFNLTSLRQDWNHRGRQCDVSFNNDVYQDAERRDFTINAIYFEPKSGQIFDFFNSMEDIEHKNLVFIGDPATRIQEDYLRILRYFRFYKHLKLDSPLNNDLISLFQSFAPLIKKLSKERIYNEIMKIINDFSSYKALYYMHKSNILQQIIPTQPNNIQALAILPSLNTLAYDKSLIILSVLLNLNNNLEDMNLILSKKHLEHLRQILLLRDFIILHNIMDYNELAKLAINYNVDTIIIALIATASLKPSQTHIYNALITLLDQKSKLKLPINGNDLLQIGITQPDIKLILNKLKLEFWNNPLLDKSTLIGLAIENNNKITK